MNKICEICSKEYNAQDSTAFFRFRFCSEECGDVWEAKAREVHMFICISPLQVVFENKHTEMVAEDTKWRRDETKSHGLNTVHLENLSGRADEKIGWLEVSEDVLEKHFQKI